MESHIISRQSRDIFRAHFKLKNFQVIQFEVVNFEIFVKGFLKRRSGCLCLAFEEHRLQDGQVVSNVDSGVMLVEGLRVVEQRAD